MSYHPETTLQQDDLSILKIPNPRIVEDFDTTAPNLDSPSSDGAELNILRIYDTVENETVALVHAVESHLLSQACTAWQAAPECPATSYRISHAGNSGYGVFAASPMERGELIITERPLLIFPQLLPYRNKASPHRLYAELEDAIMRMSPQTRDCFFDLANSSLSEPSVCKGVIDTNSLHLGTIPGGSHLYGVVCKDISRINHSCSPNAAYYFDPLTLTCNIRALFPIPEDSQIFISYIDPALPRTQRQEKLSSYGFVCSCVACGLTGIASTQSETRRALIARADTDVELRNKTLEQWARTPSLPTDYINRVDKMYVDLFEKEELYYEPVWEAFVCRLFKASCALEDSHGARRWANLAADLNRAYTGSDRGWHVVAIFPERTSWWGLRTLKRT
ncbi:hypothetical protein BC628DRAFT_1322891 [Trametes gibbosa]|nr:hypothetical protein BC628DRAFT_1322891 [Trametes gibbosa]